MVRASASAGPVTCLSAPSKRLWCSHHDFGSAGVLLVARTPRPQARAFSLTSSRLSPMSPPAVTASFTLKTIRTLRIVDFRQTRCGRCGAVFSGASDSSEQRQPAVSLIAPIPREMPTPTRLIFGPRRHSRIVRSTRCGRIWPFGRHSLVIRSVSPRTNWLKPAMDCAPIPTSDPELYQAWLAAASEPAYKLRGAQRSSVHSPEFAPGCFSQCSRRQQSIQLRWDAGIYWFLPTTGRGPSSTPRLPEECHVRKDLYLRREPSKLRCSQHMPGHLLEGEQGTHDLERAR